ncbi:MAG: sigma-54 dependent transcriptional regulator [Acidobacteriota bacterium]
MSADLRRLRVLLIDRDRPIKMLVDRPLPRAGATLVEVRSGDDTDELLAGRHYDVSQLDFELPGIGRVERRRRDDEELLLIDRLEAESPAETGNGLPDTLDSLQDDHFLTKPLGREQLRAYALAAKRELETPRDFDAVRGPMLGDSSAMRQVLGIAERIAAGAASVLIHGETGTGKTMLARRIHDLSPRAEQRFVAINCSAFQEQLLESELFGHERGSFTGAAATKEGLFEAANGGTLFLDEIGDMSSAMQAKLLQVLDDGELRRVGGTKLLKVDVRVVAASNKDLQQEVKAGRFREDLLFRLNVIHLRMPRLADRRSDIPGLIEHFLDRYRVAGQPRKQVSPEAIQLLTAYSWPGNVRELANTVEGLVLLAPGAEIQAADLPPSLRPRTELRLDSGEAPLPLTEVERLHIARTLRYTDGKKAPAARLLQIDVKTLGSKIKKYGIEV